VLQVLLDHKANQLQVLVVLQALLDHMDQLEPQDSKEAQVPLGLLVYQRHKVLQVQLV
jgi:hypothetical protein